MVGNDEKYDNAREGYRQKEDYWIRDNIKVTPTLKGPKVTWTPWKNDSELAMVREWFFPQHAVNDPYSPPLPDLRRKAVAMVLAWEYHNKDLPHSVLATASLTDAMLHDTIPVYQRAKHISDQALTSIYAMAFCRFVNGFVDRDVAKASLTALATTTTTDQDGTTTSTSRGEGSMYALASKIGMPLRFVEMRHQITHEKMPGCGVLREVVGEALEWVFERWWRVNATGDPEEAWRGWREEEERREGQDAVERERGRPIEESDCSDLCEGCRQAKKAHLSTDSEMGDEKVGNQVY